MSAVFILLIFFTCAGLMYARWLPALLAVPLMAVAIAAVSGANATELTSVFVDGSVRLAPVFVTVIFGALLSRVTLSSGIAETIVANAAEFGGDRPMVLALVLAAATALLFTSLTGLGAIIMVGSIVLPIMMTIGVPRQTAATLFLLAFALGFIFNIAQWNFYTATFGASRSVMQPFAILLAVISLCVMLCFVLVRFRLTRGYATWAMQSEEPIARRRVPWYALITPLLPIVAYFCFGVHPLVAFVLAAMYGALTTQPREIVQTLMGSAIRGIEDTAPAIFLFIGIGMLVVATALPEVRHALAPAIARFAPRTPLEYIALFGLASPLALYRGPLNPFGVGIAVYTILASLHALPTTALVAAIMAVVQVQNVCDPTNTQNVWVANFTGVPIDEITKITLPYQVITATLATFAASYLGTVAPVAAATLSPLPGLFVPAQSAFVFALTANPTNESRIGEEELARTVTVELPGFQTRAMTGDPTASDCSRKPYAAILRVDTLRYGTPHSDEAFDFGLHLEDCAGYPIDEWHVTHAIPAGLSEEHIRTDAHDVLRQFLLWRLAHQERFHTLVTCGLAYDKTLPPTYLYSLLKTPDGEMRAYVRAGGPAYVAGMRTNDIIEKVDGKFWWEYGTYQTQRKAYDSLAHRFEIHRDERVFTVTVDKPFEPKHGAVTPGACI